mmetsp:Transcript_29228/g.48292  ORF Transcript_29228/g.48292 Transcript_29228/m.48292 type:complete len:320 (-) Transcript_29228:160-1119(-)|eukprot:CAMPEP_0119015410 /NCGR_PEP_ID=MMETSP1176-20130426/10962_1 /TAXON_ID=265551 /ORGANISM="Synedropsis recta cf, Strain CCMP1620" /LENGTH=319 /DNA_ID=CAMNT_0006968701 /DNA_START=121 /DNA_END=1080 /DNA_ORIENTATION=+
MGRKPSQKNYLNHLKKQDPQSGSMSPKDVHQSDINRSDVLLGKQMKIKKHVGNISFRALIDSRVNVYNNPESIRSDKIHLVFTTTQSIYDAGGRFLVSRGLNSDTWTEVKKEYAREKVGNSIRDSVKLLRKGKRRKNSPTKMFEKDATFEEILEHLSLSPHLLCVESSTSTEKSHNMSAEKDLMAFASDQITSPAEGFIGAQRRGGGKIVIPIVRNDRAEDTTTTRQVGEVGGGCSKNEASHLIGALQNAAQPEGQDDELLLLHNQSNGNVSASMSMMARIEKLQKFDEVSFFATTTEIEDEEDPLDQNNAFLCSLPVL